MQTCAAHVKDLIDALKALVQFAIAQSPPLVWHQLSV
jgi:hypothetical protein